MSCSIASQPATVAKPAVATPATAQPLQLTRQTSRLGGDTIEFAAVRVSKPRATLVFENGLMLDLSTWQQVARALNNCCDLLFYNRPGVGQSESASTPLTPQLAADRLQRLLQQQQLSPPFVLIGHSLGGQYAQVFATRYPAQVSAMLLVDALPLGVVKPISEFPWYTRAGLWAGASAATREEIANIHAMGNYVLQQPTPFNRPMIRIVTQTKTPKKPSAGLVKNLLNGLIYAEDFGVWAVDPDEAERQLDVLYPQAEVRPMLANHRVQEQYPDAVADAIFSVLAQ
jgi:pimeloyl-ACP methyl ester carboxylesterase